MPETPNSTPHELVVSGPGLPARRVPMTGRPLTIGRNPGLDIVLEHRSISREHARVTLKGDALWIESLSEKQPLIVDGQPVKSLPLVPGASVAIGPYQLSLSEARDTATADATGSAEVLRGKLTILSALVEGFDLRRPARAYLEEMVDAVIRGVGAERGFLFAVDPTTRKARRLILRHVAGADSGLGVSDTLIRSVIRDPRPLLLLELTGSGHVASRSLEALAAEDMQSVIVCPLLTDSQLTGVFYLDSRVSLRSFAQDDLALVESVSRAVARMLDGFAIAQELESENARLWEMVEGASAGTVPVERLSAPDSPAHETLRVCKLAAGKDVAVLLTGETGSGKEVLARFIHDHSSRKTGPFIAINCAALPDGLVEHELFGSRKGTFTGSTEDRAGVIEEADGGTLFLDEVGELPLPVQAKLLRVLQERVVTRLGETKGRKVDFRLLAATLRDLEEAIREKRFREDLYYRLNVLTVKLSPLRERRMDIPLLVDYFIRTMAPKMGSTARRASPAAMAALVSYAWPGNIRQLRNAVERALVFAEGDAIQLDALQEDIRAAGQGAVAAPDPGTPDSAEPSLTETDASSPEDSGPIPYAEALRRFEQDYFENLLAAIGPNLSAVARRAQLTRVTIYRKLAQLRIAMPD